MKERLRQLRSDQSGFTLPELITAMAIGLIVLLAAFMLLDRAVSGSTRLADRQEAVQRGRLTMELITRQLRSQVCLGQAQPILAGDDNSVTFYSNLSSNPNAAQKRSLRYVAAEKRLYEDVYNGTGTFPSLTFPASPSQSREMLKPMTQTTEKVGSAFVIRPIFRYYKYVNNTTTGDAAAADDAAVGGRRTRRGDDQRRLRDAATAPGGAHHGQHRRHDVRRRRVRPTRRSDEADGGTAVLVKRLMNQSGFTTVTLMGVLLVGGLLVMASFAAVDPDISQSRDDRDTKQAYAAAESGLQWYMNGLGRDNVYYLKCDNPPAPSATEVAPVNQRYTSGTFKWRNIPNEASKYGIELIPAPGFSSCSTTDQYSVIDSEGNLQLRITGRSRDETRTIIATLRRQNFLDYIYFTHFETLDPAAYSDPVTAEANCAKYRSLRTSYCVEIQFDDDDDVLGPFHTNDNVMVCGTTQFGENSRDRIEINGSTPWVPAGGCGANPNVVGTLIHPAGELGMPPSNQELRNIALPAYRFTGKTKINLTGTNMVVTNANLVGGQQTMNLPSNGVIYVDNISCTSSYDRTADYTRAPTAATPTSMAATAAT